MRDNIIYCMINTYIQKCFRLKSSLQPVLFLPTCTAILLYSDGNLHIHEKKKKKKKLFPINSDAVRENSDAVRNKKIKKKKYNKQNNTVCDDYA